MTPEATLTSEEVAAQLKTTEVNVRYWARKGVLRGTKIGREWRFTTEAVAAFVEQGTHNQR